MVVGTAGDDRVQCWGWWRRSRLVIASVAAWVVSRARGDRRHDVGWSRRPRKVAAITGRHVRDHGPGGSRGR